MTFEGFDPREAWSPDDDGRLPDTHRRRASPISPAERWARLSGASRGQPGTAYNPFVSHAFLSCAGGIRLGNGRHRLARPASAAGRGATARFSAPCRPISRTTARANTSSTTAGPTPSSGPAGATIRSSRFPCPSRRRPVPGCWSPGADPAPVPAGACRRLAGTDAPARRLIGPCDLPAGGRMPTCWQTPAFCSAPTSSSISSTTAIARYDDFLETLASRKRKALKKERRDGAGRTASRSTG